MKQIRNKHKPKTKNQYNLTAITLLAGLNNNSISYLDANISINLQNFDYLNNQLYDLWCIDREKSFSLNGTYNDYHLFSSLETQLNLIKTPLNKVGYLNPEPLKYAEKLDNINWLINQSFFGNDYFGTGTTISAGNYQQAIWFLLNQYPPSFLPNPNTQALVDVANMHGNNFKAGCKEKLGIIISNGETVPRTQPYLLMVQGCELKIHSHKLLLRKLLGKHKYLKLRTAEGLTPGFEYFIKNKHNRTMTKIVLEPGESYEAN